MVNQVMAPTQVTATAAPAPVAVPRAHSGGLIASVKSALPYVRGNAPCNGVTVPVVNVCVPKATCIAGGLGLVLLGAYMYMNQGKSTKRSVANARVNARANARVNRRPMNRRVNAPRARRL